MEFNREFFKDLWPFVQDDNITDIQWNGRALWLDHLRKGVYKQRDFKISEDFLEITTKRLADDMDMNFNDSTPSLDAESNELRFHAEHKSKAGDNTTVFGIRKTPAYARLSKDLMIEQGYADDLILLLLAALIRARCSTIVIGDPGSGKTELEKWLAGFIDDRLATMTVEDTLEMKLDQIYPDKNIKTKKTDSNYTIEKAIYDALRSQIIWLIIAEARGRSINAVTQAASTGSALLSIHCEHTWESPDRMAQMSGTDDRENFLAQVFMFFDVSIKVKCDKLSSDGILRRIDEISFFERINGENITTIIYNKGRWTNQKLPRSLMSAFAENNEKELIAALYKRGLIHESQTTTQN